MTTSPPTWDNAIVGSVGNQLLGLLQGACNAATVGLVILDAEHHICFWNRWMEEKSGIPTAIANGRQLFKLLPELRGGRIETAVRYALEHNQPSLLSQLLNKTPFPLYEHGQVGEDTPRLQQAIHVMPIDLAGGPRHCLIQIHDVTVATKRERLLREQAVKLHANVYLDGLTGIANRRRFDEYLESEFRRAQRTCSPLSLILLDIDFFKAFNDRYGHQMGDQCLIQVAQALKGNLQRAADLVARYGGEEFAIILPASESEGATFVAEQLRAEIASMRIPHADSLIADHVTISLGVATVTPAVGAQPESLVRAADCALYEAKAQGRNRVITHSEKHGCAVDRCSIDAQCVFHKHQPQ